MQNEQFPAVQMVTTIERIVERWQLIIKKKEQVKLVSVFCSLISDKS